jgi:hypothetical protein
MFFSKNLPAWERITRVAAGILMILWGFLGPNLGGTPVGIIIAAAGGVAMLTGFYGFCPACAMVGRRADAGVFAGQLVGRIWAEGRNPPLCHGSRRVTRLCR